MGITNAEFDADFESVGKGAKKLQRKSDRKLSFLLLLLYVKVVGL